MHTIFGDVLLERVVRPFHLVSCFFTRWPLFGETNCVFRAMTMTLYLIRPIPRDNSVDVEISVLSNRRRFGRSREAHYRNFRGFVMIRSTISFADYLMACIHRDRDFHSSCSTWQPPEGAQSWLIDARHAETFHPRYLLVVLPKTPKILEQLECGNVIVVAYIRLFLHVLLDLYL